MGNYLTPNSSINQRARSWYHSQGQLSGNAGPTALRGEDGEQRRGPWEHLSENGDFLNGEQMRPSPRVLPCHGFQGQDSGASGGDPAQMSLSSCFGAFLLQSAP